MFSSAELIEALTRRGRARLWFRAEDNRPPGEFPAAWKAWFASMSERVGAVTGASADAVIGIFLQRELATRPRRTGALNRWQSFATLWRQQWQPPEREDRRVRMVAYAITLVVHLVLSVILLWLANLRFIGLPPAPQGDAIVQVEYIGEGTPDEPGGGQPTGDTAEPAATPSAAPAAIADSTAAPAPATPAPPQPVATAPPSAPMPLREPAPPAAQPLEVTQVPLPDTQFVLPPPVVRSVELPQPVIVVPELRVPTREIEIVEVPVPVRPIQPALPQPQIVVPPLRQPAPEITVREIPTPLPQVQPRAVAQRALPTPELRAPAPRVGVREIPMPAPSPATIPGTAAATPASGTTPARTVASGNTPTGNAPAPGGSPSARSGTQPAAPASGSGPAATAKPGAWPTPQRGDDWGASTRNRPGGNTGRAPGLFNADGSPRLPPGTAAPGGGLPPGTVEQRIADLDRAGTWLKRPPVDYTPTRFDKFWRPHENLLQEWVRKGIKTVAIPIPGSSKKLMCGVSLLQLGGGCTIIDPNLNDQEAIARPPPDIPFKPELQEDQDSLRRNP